jgi:hypothetical protein
MKKIMFILFIFAVTHQHSAQELGGDELTGYNLFILPAPQINVTLSLDSNNIINPNTGFSITPGAQTIDMMQVYNDINALQPKPYTPNPNTDYGRLRFKNDRSSNSLQIYNNDRFARDFRNSNPAFFEASRNTAFQMGYNPFSCYNRL